MTPYFAPAWAYGGPPRVMHEYARGLAARGHEVTVFTTDVLDGTRRAGPAEEMLDGVRVRRFTNLSNGLAWRSKKYLPRRLLSALARRAGDFDAVHVTDARTFLTAAAFLASSARGVPLCLSAHGSLPGSAGLRGAVKHGYDALLVAPMLRRAALLLAQTEHEARLYVDAGARPGAVRFLPLPLSPPPVAGSGSLRTLAGLTDEHRVLLFLGRIHRLKGLDLLLEAVEPMLRADDSLVLCVVGRDDGQWDELARRFAHLLATGSLRFVGPLYDDERFAAYADADVFCLTPRHWEETSLAALEAASCGTPLVVSEQADVPGLEAAGGGFVVPLAPHAIRDAVDRALARRQEMGCAAREHVLHQHGAEAVVARLEGYLVEAIAQGPVREDVQGA